MTSEYQVAKRPKGRVLVDYNQNAWGRTLGIGVLGAPARRLPAVSTPVTWKEIDKGCRIEDFRLDNVRRRFEKTGDLVQAASPQDAPRQLVEVPWGNPNRNTYPSFPGRRALQNEYLGASGEAPSVLTLDCHPLFTGVGAAGWPSRRALP